MDNTNNSRRKFIKGAVLLGAAGFMGCTGDYVDEKPVVVSDDKIFAPAKNVPTKVVKGPVPTKVLGKTGVTVPILSHGGTYELNNVMVANAFELGINYFDTADCYLGGQSEVVLGKVLEKQGKRKEAFIVSKDHPQQPKDMLTTINKRLENLRTDYLDCYFIHQLGDGEYPKECVTWPKSQEMKEVAEKLKKDKKIKFFGFSCHAGILPEALEAASEGGFIDMIMFRYSFRDAQNDAVNRAIDQAKAAKIGLIAMKTQGGKVFHQEKADEFKQKGFNQFQSTLKAVWADDRIDTIVSSMPTLQIVQENALAALQNEISQAERELLDQYAQATNSMICHGCDHVCSPHVEAPVRIGDTLRYLMYHDNYQETAVARDLFGKLPLASRQAILQADYTRAEIACPYGVQIGRMMADAMTKLA